MAIINLAALKKAQAAKAAAAAPKAPAKAPVKPVSKSAPAKPETNASKKLISSPRDESSPKAAPSALIKRGYGAVKEREKQFQERREQAGKKLWRIYFPNGEARTMRFLNEEPITLELGEHRVEVPGKKTPEFYTCVGEDCRLCVIAAKGSKRVNKARFVGAYVVLDRDAYEIQSGTRKGETIVNEARLLVEGQQTLAQFEQFSSKKGLTSRDYEITRNEKIKTIIPGDKEPLSREDTKLIKALLEKHEVDSIDELIVQQLEMQTLTAEQLEEQFGSSADTDEEDDEPRTVSKPSNNKIRSFAKKF